MLVIAKPGTSCPKENSPREYIGDTVPVEVPRSAYYRRRLADGSIGPVVTETQAATAIEHAVSDSPTNAKPKNRKAE